LAFFEDFTASVFYQNISNHISEDTIVELTKEFPWAVGIRVVRSEELSE
jgi:hypothetical protein